MNSARQRPQVIRVAIGVLLASCGSVVTNTSPSVTSSNTVPRPARVINSLSIQAGEIGTAATPLTIDLGARSDSKVLSPSRVVYQAKFNDDAYGLGLDLQASDGAADGPAGFGVDDSGTLHVVDGVNHRVVQVTADGTYSSVSFPAELQKEWIAGFAVAPDGTEYVTLRDGVAIIRGAKMIKRFANSDLGIVASQLEPRATTDGLFISSGNLYLQVLNGKAEIVRSEDALVLHATNGTVISTTSSERGAPVVTYSRDGTRFALTIVGTPQPAGVYVADFLSDGSFVVLARSASAELPDNTQLIVVASGGTVQHAAIEVPGENMVQNGMYARLANGFVYLEVGDTQGVSVYQFDPTKLRGV